MAYQWTRTLRNGMSGNDVRELQIRVAGYAAATSSRTHITVDGQFGPATEGAVRRFQASYNLSADGVAGPQTHTALNNLEAADGSTRHFNWSEFHSRDGSRFSGGAVSATQVQENVRRLMYKLEAKRRKLGNIPLTINSGFRSRSHNSSVGGASNSQHLYGSAADVSSSTTPTRKANTARTCGFSGIIIYQTFTHVDSRAETTGGGYYWP
ncbi:D-Ala-D-Ala carboxypeptidase family metallohydrolase [Shouchella lehensis]|uniref:Muramoyltetrapeptide carboxypeptidase n=1 Tax=Shouchella lehensis TaxID=300825 RepID=A0A4Y7WSE3_9BACI|nr:D-Ala-D-Ala carboxypeptidase family metallohydrolase [Shouchella lehensis]TES51408.1 muramoyltetrapeptide carboxypeptidase [Shouchella lehensis]